MAKARLTSADLKRKVAELEAQLAHVYHFASATIDKAGDSHMGSAVIVRLTSLGGREITPAFAVKNGLSAETIAALKADMIRSYASAIEFQPRGYAAITE